MKLKRDFYERPTLEVAKDLLGKTLVKIQDEKIYRVKIVECEAYLGLEDRAAHSFHGKITPRVKSMWGEAGVAYVYFTYGMYYCMNVVTEKEGIPNAVLIRAAEPLEGLDFMSLNRYGKVYSELTKPQKKNLLNGPAKLCQCLNIDREYDGMSLLGNELYIEEGETVENVVVTGRIGIENSKEAKDYLYRFYIGGSPYVSKR